MITLEEVTERNWLTVRRLAVAEEQRGFLDSAVGILARGYVYRDCRPRLFAVTIMGLRWAWLSCGTWTRSPPAMNFSSS